MFSIPTVAATLLPTPLRVHVPPRSSPIAMGDWMAPGGSSGAFLREEFLLKNFLCQRAIQTQLYIHTQMKNEFHKDWLMQFVEDMGGAHLCAGSRVLHSHTALGTVPWNEFLVAVMDAPDETQEIEVTWGNRRIGGAPSPAPIRPAVELYCMYSVAKKRLHYVSTDRHVRHVRCLQPAQTELRRTSCYLLSWPEPVIPIPASC